MKIFPFQAVYPEFDLVASTDSFIKSVKHQFKKYRETGFFHKASKEAFYIHEIVKNNRTYRGFIASTALEEFEKESILIHENTLASKRQITMELMIDREAVIKPLLVAYDNSKAIDQLLEKICNNQKPHYQTEFEEEKIKHRYYQISEAKDIKKLIDAFAKLDRAYIADGHHRRAVLLDLMKSGQLRKKEIIRKSILTAYFPFSELDIHDFNRVVDIFDIISPVRFLVELTKYFKLENLQSAAKPDSKFQITAFINGEWIKMTWKKSVLAENKQTKVLLDADLINIYVFNKILGIKDVRQTTRIKYIEGVKDLDHVVNIVNSDFKKAAFFISPVDKSELKKIAENNLSMPPKSTWFEPRLKNGLISEEF